MPIWRLVFFLRVWRVSLVQCKCLRVGRWEVALNTASQELSLTHSSAHPLLPHPLQSSPNLLSGTCPTLFKRVYMRTKLNWCEQRVPHTFPTPCTSPWPSQFCLSQCTGIICVTDGQNPASEPSYVASTESYYGQESSMSRESTALLPRPSGWLDR